MRFYLLTVQHNVEKNAENRVAPKAFDTEEDAVAEFHSQMGKDMKNSTLDWAISIVVNEFGGIVKNERWTKNVEPAIVEDGSRANPIVFRDGMTVQMGLWYKYDNDIHNIVQLCTKDGVPSEFFDTEYFVVEQFYLDNKDML
jgi:hypothetical protein